MINLELRRKIAELRGWKNITIYGPLHRQWLLGDDPSLQNFATPEYEHKIEDALPLMNQLVNQGNVLVTETTDIATSIDVNGITISLIGMHKIPRFDERLAACIAETWLTMKEDELGLN